MATHRAEPDDVPLPAPESKWAAWAWARACLVLTVVLHTAAFPPYGVAEAAYVFAVPVALWCLRRPCWTEFLVVVFGANLVSWAILLEWLRALTKQAGPVALLGLAALAAVMALFPTAWSVAARVALPRAAERGMAAKLAVVAGLAGAWVVLEWVRGWIGTGFPWLPLAASQWERPALLQGAAFGGAWVVSFALVLFNLGLAAYLRRLESWVRERKGRFCPEFYLAMIVLFVVSFGLYGGVAGQRREKLFTAGIMQPYVPQSVKWDPAEERRVLSIIEDQVRQLRLLGPEVIFGPEAVTPAPLVGDPEMRRWVEELARKAERPIIAGAVAYEAASPSGAAGPAAAGRWTNGIFVVDPQEGVQPAFYRKRHLVPFGEYLPFRRFLPFMEKLVPIGGDFEPGTDPAPLRLSTAARTTSIGPLVCYEDVFPGLARRTAAAGADLLFVATNNGWFGETGAPCQHAAHSVLRAVETRRPVLRVGNGGWSGWIDEYGRIRDVLRNERQSIYHRGFGMFAIDRDARWEGRQTLYVRWGDWFVGLSAALAAAGWVAVRRAKRPD